MAELLKLPAPAAAAEAPHLLSLADELGLMQLRRAAVAFIAQHYTEVKVSLLAGWLTRLYSRTCGALVLMLLPGECCLDMLSESGSICHHGCGNVHVSSSQGVCCQVVVRNQEASTGCSGADGA